MISASELIAGWERHVNDGKTIEEFLTDNGLETDSLRLLAVKMVEACTVVEGDLAENLIGRGVVAGFCTAWAIRNELERA